MRKSCGVSLFNFCISSVLCTCFYDLVICANKISVQVRCFYQPLTRSYELVLPALYHNTESIIQSVNNYFYTLSIVVTKPTTTDLKNKGVS